MKPTSLLFRLTKLACAVSLATATLSVNAAPIGNLQSFDASKVGNEWDIQTSTGMRLRISLIAPDVVRVWAGAKGELLGAGDKAAAIVVGTPEKEIAHSIEQTGDAIELKTDALRLHISRKPLRLALYRAGEKEPLWQEMQPLDIADKQSVQTLSSNSGERFFGGGQQNGRFEFKGKQLDISYSGGWEEGDRPSPAPFLMSSRAWGMLRNTWADGNYDLRQNEQIVLQHQEKRFDAYYFVGKEMRDVLARYTALTGRARMLPRWALEYGDADCYNDGDNVKKPGTVPKGWSDGPTGKTPDVITSVAQKYREHDMPGGWILPNDGYGCGYSDLEKTVAGLAKYGFRTGLWTENGVDKIAWEVGKAGTRAQKLDVAWTGKGYQFSLDANQAAYQGILNNSDARPFIWTVMGWAGTQRYAVTWTGDQAGSWDYIRWHIPTLIGSGLSGQAYATGDVDGIFGGSPETFTRDLQWKSFTPVLMGMSGWSASGRKHPWWFDEPYRSINRRYLKLKMRLTPYMYTLAHEAEQTGAPLVRGLMWDHPNDPQAFTEAHKYQFLLGRELLVAPVYRSQAASQGWRKDIHLPMGTWIDYWDGRQVTASIQGRNLDRQVTLDTLPLFVRAGAILPMYPEMLFDGEKPKDVLTLDLYPHGSSQFTLYEDDGVSREYAKGAKSEQQIAVHTGANGTGDVSVGIGAVNGSYAEQEAQRAYAVRMLSRSQPQAVMANGHSVPQVADKAAFDAATSAWYFDANERHGSVHIKTLKQDIRLPLQIIVRRADASVVADDIFPVAPELGRALAPDAIVIVNRPSEEAGHPLENALDDKPETWFRTTRSPAMRSGPHEWTLGMTERRLLDGIALAPRTDANWKYGQIRDYEIYISDNNGDWGQPIKRGRLQLQQGPQQIDFTPTAGRMLRFRVLSTHNPEGDGASSTDPMVTALSAAQDANAAKAFNAQEPAQLDPITLSRFHLLEHRAPAKPEQQRYLSDLPLANGLRRDQPASSAKEMRMNGLLFRKGIGMSPNGRLDLQLKGDWHTLRADLGVDDSCRAAGGVQFQVWSGARMLYASGTIAAPAVVKPELDVRGLTQLSLRMVAAKPSQGSKACGNWANAMLLGREGDEVK